MSAKTVALWIARVLMAALFLYAGSNKLRSAPEAVAIFETLGAPWLRWVIGACEVAGGIGILLPQTAGLAALCLALLMVGAAGSHVLALGVDTIAPSLVALVLCSWIAWQLRGVRASRTPT